MSEFKIQSSIGEVDLSNSKYFYLLDVNNQTFFDTSIYSIDSVSDGSLINSIRVNPRSITFTLRVKSNYDPEEVKRYLFRYLKPKREHTIVWERDGRALTIQGMFESATMPRWTNKVAIQLSFYCPNCFWVDKDNVIQEIDDIIPLHAFTTQEDDMLFFIDDGIVFGEYDLGRTRIYENYGDVETGLEITIHALDTVSNPIIYLNSPDNYIGIKDTLEKDDIVVITTEKGNKNIKKNGVSVLNKLIEGSSFIQLEVGHNTFSVDNEGSATDNLYFTVSYKQKYI